MRKPTQPKETRPVTAKMPFPAQVKAVEGLIKAQPETSRVLEIGPELAEYILTQKNISNRPMKPSKIKEYAEALRADQWGLTGDTLKFGADGTLKDGQNRLAAVVRANGPSLVSHAVFGVSPSLFARMDIGKNRTAADVFNIAGLHYANHAAATVRWLLILTGPNPANRAAHFTNEELLDAYRNKFDPIDIENSVRIGIQVKQGTGAPVGSTAALHYLLAKDNRETANKFFTEWGENSGKATSPTRVLQAKLQEIMLATNNRVHETLRNAMIIQAFIAYRDHKPLRKSDLDFNVKEDTFPEINSKPLKQAA